MRSVGRVISTQTSPTSFEPRCFLYKYTIRQIRCQVFLKKVINKANSNLLVTCCLYTNNKTEYHSIYLYIYSLYIFSCICNHREYKQNFKTLRQGKHRETNC